MAEMPKFVISQHHDSTLRDQVALCMLPTLYVAYLQGHHRSWHANLPDVTIMGMLAADAFEFADAFVEAGKRQSSHGPHFQPTESAQ